MKAKLINEVVGFEKYKDPKKALFPDPTQEELYQKKIQDERDFNIEIIKLLNQASDNGLSYEDVTDIIDKALNEIEWKEEYI